MSFDIITCLEVFGCPESLSETCKSPHSGTDEPSLLGICVQLLSVLFMSRHMRRCLLRVRVLDYTSDTREAAHGADFIGRTRQHL